MKEKRMRKFVGLAAALAVFACSITGCMSMMVGMAKSMYKDYGVYDKSVPEDQLCDFRFVGVNIKSFNGKPVKWGDKANNMGHIKVPAGTHNIVYDWVQEQTRQTGSSYNSGTGTTTLTYTTTTRSLRDITISQIDFLPGHNYSLAGAWIGGEVRIYMQDVTNTLTEMFGDRVAAAPKVSNTPTEFEGTWEGTDTTRFKFAGNTWESIIPPGIATNYTDNEAGLRGTFEKSNDKIIMYMTHVLVDGKSWYDVTAIKQATIWTYFFDDENLNLEVEYLLPNITYTKQ